MKSIYYSQISQLCDVVATFQTSNYSLLSLSPFKWQGQLHDLQPLRTFCPNKREKFAIIFDLPSKSVINLFALTWLHKLSFNEEVAML